MVEETEVDEMDPTLPPTFGDDEFEVVETIDGLEEDPEGWTLADGFIDGSGTVRLWTDETGRLERVQLARYWRDQIKQSPLELCFAEIFVQLSMLFGGIADPWPEAEETESDDLLSGDLIDRVVEEMAAVDARIAELDELDEGYSVWSGEPVTGSAEEGRVRLTLSITGVPEVVTFEPRWLAEASSAAVCRSVLTAYAEARSKHRPPVHLPGERAQLAAKYHTLAKRLEDAALRGFEGLVQVDPDQAAAAVHTPSQQESTR